MGAQPGSGQLEIETYPRGAVVHQIQTDNRNAAVSCGNTSGPFKIDASEGFYEDVDYKLILSLPQHYTTSVTIPHEFLNQRFPELIELKPFNYWVGFKDWCRANLPLLQVTLVGLGTVALGALGWRSRRRSLGQLREVQAQVEVLEQQVEEDTLIGMVLLGYTLREPLGTGGAADVYLGVNDREKVAIKVLRSANSEELQRFKREVEIARSLHHPNILLLYGYGEERGRFFLVLELMPGGTLREQLQGPLSPEQALKFLKPLFAATGYAHSLGVIHRDLKPENVMISADGVLKVADFGMAKMSAMNTVTQDGTILGTPAYMSPEQVKGISREPRIDQYALGVMSFEMLMGRRPYSDDNPIMVIFKHVNDPIPAMTPTVSPAVESVVHRMMAKEAEQRYPSVSEAWDALERAVRVGE